MFTKSVACHGLVFQAQQIENVLLVITASLPLLLAALSLYKQNLLNEGIKNDLSINFIVI